MTHWRAEAWAEAVRTGIRARGLSLDEAARRIGVPTSTLRSWIEHRHAPKVTVFDHWAQLAEVTGLGEAELLRVAGVLPDSLATPVHVAQAAKALREGIDQAGRFLRQATALVYSSPGTQVANAIAASPIDWEMRIRSATRGDEVRITYHHYVGVVPPRDFPHDDAEARRIIEHDILGELWRPLGLYWRVAEVHDWHEPPRLVIQVPEQEATRPPVPSPVVTAPPVVVLSPIWGYGELLASLVADGLGFGNVDFRYFGLPDAMADRVRITARELGGPAPRLVQSVPPIMLLHGLPVPDLTGRLQVVVRYGPRMRARAARIYRDPLLEAGFPDSEAGTRAIEDAVGKVVAGLPSGCAYFEVTLDDADVFDGDHASLDRLNDTVAWLAEQIVEHVLLTAGRPPVPLGGPLKRLVLPSGRVRRPPALASRTVRRVAGTAPDVV